MLVSGFFDGAYIGQDENGAIYDRSYQAEFFARYFSSFVSNGVFNKNVDSFKVVPLDGLNIVVKSGSCFINGYFGFEKEHNELILDENINSNSRVDRIILRLDLSSRDITIQVLKGEEAEEPTPKELNRSGDIYEIALADITISSNLENITNENIKDLRENNDLCGYVNHTLEEVDQNIFYNQIFKYLRKSRIKEKDEFKKWFEDIKSVLNTNTVSKHIVKSVFSESGVHNFRYNINTNKFEKFNNDTQEFEKIKLGADTTLKKTPKIILKSYMKRITISWKDTEDVTVKGEIVRRWKGTILVKKIGSPPLSYDDGEILVNNTERNKYLNTPFIDENIESNIEYFYGVFPYDDEGNYNVNIQNIVHGHENLLEEMFFSFIVDLNESNTLNNITYADDSEQYTDPESWKHSPLIQSIKPCLLKDGQVNYYLDPNNYDLKLNGEPSNLNGDDGDVMIEFPALIFKMEFIEDLKVKFTITADEETIKNNNDENWIKVHLDYYNGLKISNKFYHSVYMCTEMNNQLSSIPTNNKLPSFLKLNDIIEKLNKKNENNFFIHQCTTKLLTLLGWLIFKTTNLQKVFNLKNNDKYTIGSLKTGGLFSGCGSETPQNAVKFFGIEIPYTNNNLLGKIIVGGGELVRYYRCSNSYCDNHIEKGQVKYTYNNVFKEKGSDGLGGEHVTTVLDVDNIGVNGNLGANPQLFTLCNNFKDYEKYGFLGYRDSNSKYPQSLTKDNYLAFQNNLGSAGRGTYLFSMIFLDSNTVYRINYNTNEQKHIINGCLYYMYLPPNEE